MTHQLNNSRRIFLFSVLLLPHIKFNLAIGMDISDHHNQEN